MIKKEQWDLFLENLKVGMSIAQSAVLVGMSREAHYKRALTDKAWGETVDKAQMECIKRNVVRIQNASKKSWTAAAWWLERKFPEEFGAKSQVAVTGPKGRPLAVKTTTEVDWSKVAPEIVKEIALKHFKPADVDKGD